MTLQSHVVLELANVTYLTLNDTSVDDELDNAATADEQVSIPANLRCKYTSTVSTKDIPRTWWTNKLVVEPLIGYIFYFDNLLLIIEVITTKY